MNASHQILCILAISTQALGAVQLGVTVYGNGVEETHHQSRLIGTELEARLSQELTETLDGEVRAGFQLETGSSKALYSDEYGPKQTLKLRSARFGWNAFEWLRLEAGAIDQDTWKTPLLLSGQTFPALTENVRVSAGPFVISIAAEQSIAATGNATGRFRESGIPTFFMERATVLMGSNERLTLSARASHFSFANLHESVAAHGRIFGNTVDGVGAPNSVFSHEFRGFEAGAGISWKSPFGVDPELEVSQIWNTSAPGDRRRAFLAAAGFRIRIEDDLVVKPELEWFRVESDASPSYFNAKRIGHNNRNGWGAALLVRLPKSKIDIDSRATISSVIEESPYQSEFKHFQFSIRSEHDFL